MNKEIELETCPFCGGSPHVHIGMFPITYIICEDCGAVTSFQGHEKLDDAVKMYNQRALQGAQTGGQE